jgi:hypothetical protein
VLVVLAALLVGGVPALKATGAVMQARLKQAGASGSSMRYGRLWTGIVVVQVALTLIFLLTTLSLGLETYRLDRRFQEVSFPRQEYLTARVNAPEGFPPERAKAAFGEIERRLAQEPSVTNISWTTRFPGMGQEEFWVELPVRQMQDEAVARSRDDVLWVRSARVAADFFDTLKVPLVAGRMFTLSETELNHPVAIVDESFVRLVLGGRAAVGQLVRQAPRGDGDPPGPWLEIVGVVKDISTLANKHVDEAMLYRPFTPAEGNQRAWPWRIIIHVNGDAAALATPLRRATVAADAGLRLEDVLTMDRVAEADALAMNFFVNSLGVVSALALLLSIAGIYSLISFTLARRTREIGIRIALGAAPRRIVTGVLSKALFQIGVGVVVGAIPGVTILALGLEDDTGGTTLIQAIGLTLGMAAFVLGIAAISCAVPLRRALRVEPTQALRADG